MQAKPKDLKVINLWGTSSDKPNGHLVVSFPKENHGEQKIDADVLSIENHPNFVNSYTGLYLANPEAYTIKVNPAYEKIAFLPDTDLVGRSLRELEEKGYFSKSVTLVVLEKLKQGGSGSVSFFQKIITGKEVLVTGTPIYSEPDSLAYVLTYVQDLLPLAAITQKCIEHDEKFRISVPRPLSAPAVAKADHHSPSTSTLPKYDRLPMIARDPLSIATLQQVVCAAKYESPILLTGETGVGKDLIANYLHLLHKGGNDRPFVAVNCSAIPGELLESELFGYAEGAFSGARKGGKTGLFAQAHGGILFLNEISEMPLHLQAKLLTALDEGCIRPLGSSKAMQVKTRIVCATNLDLQSCIVKGSFRSDLYYRINVLAIHLPPLRDRPQDILPLLHHFVTRFSREYDLKRYLSPAVQEILLNYYWPGNVRELRNLVERLLVFSTTEQITLCDLPSEISGQPTAGGQADPVMDGDMSLKENVRRYEQALIEKALQRHGKISDAARMLGIDPTTLTRKLKKAP
jgi:transcriptional regulator with PAS, ATPase and Fis domain